MAADQSRSDDVVHDGLGDSLGADSWVLASGCYSGGRPQRRDEPIVGHLLFRSQLAISGRCAH